MRTHYERLKDDLIEEVSVESKNIGYLTRLLNCTQQEILDIANDENLPINIGGESVQDKLYPPAGMFIIAKGDVQKSSGDGFYGDSFTSDIPLDEVSWGYLPPPAQWPSWAQSWVALSSGEYMFSDEDISSIKKGDETIAGTYVLHVEGRYGGA